MFCCKPVLLYVMGCAVGVLYAALVFIASHLQSALQHWTLLCRRMLEWSHPVHNCWTC